ncbi:MAG: PKD domain-containing protein, partial [Gemmatimonadetes bacterium]|nr:PKD domain-containing protein [Gemmatimonadota bacterium]
MYRILKKIGLLGAHFFLLTTGDIQAQQISAGLILPDTAEQGERIEVKVSVGMYEGEERLGAYKALLYWDPDVLQFIRTIEGITPELSDPITRLDPDAGELTFSQFSVTGAREWINLINVEFKVIGNPGTDAEIQLEFSKFAAAETFKDLLPNLLITPQSIHIIAPTLPPVAGFTASSMSGETPFPVIFTDISQGQITSRSWDFGDGNSSIDQDPTHIFTEAAEYTITLTVSGPGGTDEHSLQIVVAEPTLPPVAYFTVNPTSGTAPLEVVFTDESSGEITSRQWDFGDGNTDTTAHPTHIFTDPRSYIAVLTVTGPGGVDASSVEITVREPVAAPTAGFTATPTSGDAPLTVSFTDASSGEITSRMWDFGDGSTSNEPNPIHIFTEAAEYTVTLAISGSGGTDAHSLQIVVAELELPSDIDFPALPPVADFTVNPTSGTAPLEVVFVDESSGEITRRQWDFGDESTDTVAHPTHIYADPGSYTAVLTVTGPGGTDNRTVTIVVEEKVLPSPEAIIETEAEGGIIHFGEVGSDEMVESPFRILNEAGSSEAVLEGNISISGEGFYLGGFDDATGDYFEFSDGTFTVTPGQDEEMFFSFAASLVGNRVGAHEGVVVIQTNDPKKPEIIISLQGSIAQEENLPPTATITSPANGASFFEGETITFRGRGIDPEEGSLGGNYLEWASNIDGQLGIGSTVSVADLSVGSHEITLSASDSEKKVGEATIEIGIQEAPPPETTVCSRDFNGSGSVDFGDFFTLVGQFGNNSRSSTWDPRLDLDQSGHIGNGDLFLLADVFSLSCGDEFPDPGEPGANARAVVEFLPSETDHVKGGGEVHIPIKARELNGVTQMEFLLKFEPSDAFDIEASSWDNNSGFLSLTLEVIDVGKAKIGGIRLSAGELEGEADLGTLILKMKDSYSSGTEATVEIVQISLGPTSAVHDVIVPVGNTITIGGRQNQPPSVTISIPDSGGSYTFGNRVIFRGSASDPEDEELNRSALVWNSNLDGRLGEGPFLTTTRLSVGRHEIRLTATDSEGESVSEKITITILEPNQPPEAQITSPLDGSEFLQGENVVFRGTGRDPEQGQLTGNSLEWQSSQDGFLGTDRSVSSSTLSVGLHQITLTVTDRGGVPGSDQISITIREQPEDPPVDLEERIVFTAPDKGGVNQIFSMSPDGDNIVKMTDSPGNKLFPRLSPDGTKIAYQQGGSGPFDLWVSDVEGRKPYKIIDGANSELINFDRGTYTWHPDSRHLFYSATWESAGEEWIYSVRIDGGDHQVVIRNANGPVSFPILNDNGKQLIYVLSFNSFWSRNLDTGADYQILAPNGQVDIEPAMSPDGKHIAWMQMQEGRSDIYRMLIDGTNVTPLTEAPANIWLSSPCWSPDGRRLVYTKL